MSMEEEDARSWAPATSGERENEMIDLAVELTKRQLREGTASAQVITHYLKLGSSRELLEQERIRGQNALDAVKAEMIESAARTEELYANAIRAMKTYTGQDEYVNREDVDGY